MIATEFDIGYSMGVSAGMSSARRRRGLSLGWVLVLVSASFWFGVRHGYRDGRIDCSTGPALRVLTTQEMSPVSLLAPAALVGFALVYARTRADSEPARRSYPLEGDRFTYSRPGCDHADTDIDELEGVVYCLDCGCPLEGVS